MPLLKEKREGQNKETDKNNFNDCAQSHKYLHVSNVQNQIRLRIRGLIGKDCNFMFFILEFRV